MKKNIGIKEERCCEQPLLEESRVVANDAGKLPL